MRPRLIDLVARGIPFLILVGAVGFAGASDEPSEQATYQPQEAPVREFGEVFVPVARISLFEIDSVINVTPVVRLDPHGGLLVADESEKKIRRYAGSGDLLWQVGRSGPGPFEFRGPTVAIRLNNDSILAMDALGKSLFWSESGREFRGPLTNEFGTVVDVDALAGRNSVLFSSHPVAQGQGRSGPALHIVDLGSGAIVTSFFSPPVNRYTSRVIGMAGWTQSAVRSQVIATVFAFADTVYIHDLDGALVQKVPLPTSHFTRFDDVPTRGTSVVGWLFDHTFASEVHWISNEGLIVQFQEFENNVPQWRLISVRRDGTGDWQILDAPRLFAVDGSSGLFYFDDPDELTPNHLLIAELVGDG